MIDQMTLQTMGIMLAALSFVIAAIYYAMNLREIARNRRITLTTTLLQPFMTEEGNRLHMYLWDMEWSNLDEYNSKYDHRASPESYAKRMAAWNRFESIGLLYREGLLDMETLFSSIGGIIAVLWRKYEPIVEMYRETDYDKSAYENWEYLANEMLRLGHRVSR